MERIFYKILVVFFGLWMVGNSVAGLVMGKEFVVVIDAGHGGNDPGAIGRL